MLLAALRDLQSRRVGQISLTRDGKTVATAGAGEVFGEMAPSLHAYPFGDRCRDRGHVAHGLHRRRVQERLRWRSSSPARRSLGLAENQKHVAQPMLFGERTRLGCDGSIAEPP